MIPFRLTDLIGAALAILNTLGLLVIAAFLLVREMPEANEKSFAIILIALVGFEGIIFGYYLGSSSGSEKKSEVIEKIVTDQAPKKNGGPEA